VKQRQPKVTVKSYNNIQRLLLRTLRQAEKRLEDGRVRFPVVVFASLTGCGKKAITMETVCGKFQAKQLVRQHLAMGSELRALRLEFIWNRAALVGMVKKLERELVKSFAQ
jgi:hypothetical protein